MWNSSFAPQDSHGKLRPSAGSRVVPTSPVVVPAVAAVDSFAAAAGIGPEVAEPTPESHTTDTRAPPSGDPPLPTGRSGSGR